MEFANRRRSVTLKFAFAARPKYWGRPFLADSSASFAFPDQPKVNPNQSGRLELAQWLTSEKNPLTQRVIVNRIWQHLFHQGIVTSVDNFGVNGDRPSHPELLDYLARQFVQGGWSVKKLVRMVVLSHSYRLSAESSPANIAVDPANRLVWRHSPRRLEAEEIRDAMLAVSGKLNLARPEASPAKILKVIEMQNNGAEAKRAWVKSLAECPSKSVFAARSWRHAASTRSIRFRRSGVGDRKSRFDDGSHASVVFVERSIRPASSDGLRRTAVATPI